MGLQDFAAIFNNLDTACKGFITENQLLKLHEHIHFVSISPEHVQAAISHVCHVPGQIHRNEFLDVLEELQRRRSTEEHAYWDFQALDYNGTDRISLKDALLLFREFHGERFSMYTWHHFLESRNAPSADVCFDEIRLWLCDYPQGEPATPEQIIELENRIEGNQRKFWEDEMNSFKVLQDSHTEMLEYQDNTQHHARRKLAKWKKHGVEAMLFDDGLEAEDLETPSKPTNQMSLNSVLEMLETKYELLRKKLLMEMAKKSSTLEGDQPEIFEELCKQERQLSRQGNLEDEVSSLPGAGMQLGASLLSLIGEIRNVDERRKGEALQKVKQLQAQGYTMMEIGQVIQDDYKSVVQGDPSCGEALLHLYKRCKEEKEFLLSHVKSEGGSTAVLVVENSKLTRQQLLLGEEDDFQSGAIAVGVAERKQEYKSDRLLDWDRLRTERQCLTHLQERKGRKQRKTPQDEADIECLEELGLVNLQKEFTSEVVKKHFFEREALIQMLQGRESAGRKADAKSMTQEYRNRSLKTLRNQHSNWKNTSSPDPLVIQGILLEAVGLYYENRKVELQQYNPKISEEETNGSVLADLQQRQEVEFDLKIQELHSKSKEEILDLIIKENKKRRQEHFDNIAYVILGTVEITEDEREYILALEEKYNALRERVITMGLKDEKGVEWKRMPDKEKKKEVKERKKKEVKLRGEGCMKDLDDLVGPRGKAKMLPSLRKLMGEEKGEFSSRLLRQRETGEQYDEASRGSFESINILADLMNRCESEKDDLLVWLKQSDTKILPVKVQRLKILLLKLETFAGQIEDDFEVAARFVGLLERVEAALHGRHMSDNMRQQDLACRRANLHRKRLLDNDMYEKKVIRSYDPDQGDVVGWQMAYLQEVMMRHDEEREQLLQYLQDESLDDLTEAANMMSDQEKKLRLAELHAKRRKLDLSKADDQDENVSILEEAVAIRFVCCRQEIEKETRRVPGKDDIMVSLLKDLQEEQDREIATILEGIADLDESELRKKRSEEKESRDLRELSNVFIILTQSEGKAHRQQLIKALTLKYEALQESLIREVLEHQHGITKWKMLGSKDKQQMIAKVKQQIATFRVSGNNVGILEVQGRLRLEKTVTGLMGMRRHDFIQMVHASNGEDIMVEPSEPPPAAMYNVFNDLWIRYEEEKKQLMQKLKGLREEYMSDVDQQIHLVRVARETLLCCHDNKFSLTSMLVGLAERQRQAGIPRLSGDRERYETLARHRLNSGVKREDTYVLKDEICKGPSKKEQMDSAIELLLSKHRSEQDLFAQLLLSHTDPAIIEALVVLTQQQRKDRLHEINNRRQEIPPDKSKDHEKLFQEGVMIKRELCRHRMTRDDKLETSDSQVNQLMMAELLLTQNMEVEKLLSEFLSMNEVELYGLQEQIIRDRKLNVCENVAVVVFSSGLLLDGSTEMDILEALDGKYDALRDKLLAEALMKQLGDAEWQRMSELERQRKLAELKLKQKQLRREGKFDELAHILGDAFENQETLKRLMGETKEEQERKMRERLQRRKQRLSNGMTVEECDKLEAEEIAQEDEEEKKKRRNILLDLEHRFEEEKAELLRQINEGDNHLSKEKSRQLQLMKLRRDERKARNEDKFDSAALVLGLAEHNEKHRQEVSIEERTRQQKLAKERLEAARKRREAGKNDPSLEEITMDSTNQEDLREAFNVAIDRRHRNEREMMIQILDGGGVSEVRDKVRQMSQEECDLKQTELTELHRLWRLSDCKDSAQLRQILTETAAFLMELELKGHQVKGGSESEEEVKVMLLSDLQLLQDEEARSLLLSLHGKDTSALHNMLKYQVMRDEEGCHENVSHVLLRKFEVHEKGEEPGEDGKLIEALEQKYDTVKDKLLEAILIGVIGEDEWNKLSGQDKQKRLVELKMKERRLRQEGHDDEAAALFDNVLESDHVLNELLGEDKVDQQLRKEERNRRKEDLKKEREEQGLPTDDETLKSLLDEEDREEKKTKRRNVLENLDMMLEKEKAALLKMLKDQHNHIDEERQRQLTIAKLKHDQKRLKREEKLDSVALILSLGKQAEDLHRQKIMNDREVNKALAKERLEARRRKIKQKQETENLEEKLRADDERNKLEDAINGKEMSAVHSAILEAVEQRQSEERDLLMDLVTAAKSNNSVLKAAKKMNAQELKTRLMKLEQDEKNWRKKSQQEALRVNEKMLKKEQDEYYKGVTERRKEQNNILSEAMVYRMELELQHTSASSEDEVTLTMLTELQEKQQSENRVINSLLQSQEEAALNQIKDLQRAGKREGWFDNITGILFSLSTKDDTVEDDSDLQILEEKIQNSDKQMQEERENLILEARANNYSGEEIQAALRQLENEQMHKRKRLEDDMSAQRKKILDRVAARKKQNMDMEMEQLTAMQLVLVAESQKKQQQEAVDREKSNQGNELQKRLDARRLARKQNVEEASKKTKDGQTDQATISGSSTARTIESNPFSAVKREKTVVNVVLTDKEREDELRKLHREQSNLRSRIQDQQKQQEEMLQRRLKQRKNKKEMEAQQLLSLGERQKTNLMNVRQDEKSRQIEAIQERVRGRSRSPNKASRESAKSITEEEDEEEKINDK